MHDLALILIGGFAMSAIAMVGSVTTLLPPATIERLLLPLVALAAGTLLGGAFFHMIPEGSAALDPLTAGAWLVAGFTVFLALEQFVHWHQGHGTRTGATPPVTYFILGGDAVHNFLGGLGVASTFLVDARAGIIAWLAAAAHEVPQELGDFGVLVHGGWPPRRALLWNVVSALTFPLGAVVAYVAARRVDVAGLVLFAAGNFIYIAASDLIPEIKSGRSRGSAVLHFGCFIIGLSSMFAVARWMRPG
jgi:zinc and cadmium transporter